VIDVIIPVYKGFSATRRCIASVLANPQRTLELRTARAVDLPPPVENEPLPPPPEAEKPPAAPPEPLLADTPQQIPLSADLEVAMGSGGALA